MRVFRKVSSMHETSYISTDDRFAAVVKRLRVEVNATTGFSSQAMLASQNTTSI